MKWFGQVEECRNPGSDWLHSAVYPVAGYSDTCFLKLACFLSLPWCGGHFWVQSRESSACSFPDLCRNVTLLFSLGYAHTPLHAHMYIARVQVGMTNSCYLVGVFYFFMQIYSFVIPSSLSLGPVEFSVKKSGFISFSLFHFWYCYPIPGFYDRCTWFTAMPSKQIL